MSTEDPPAPVDDSTGAGVNRPPDQLGPAPAGEGKRGWRRRIRSARRERAASASAAERAALADRIAAVVRAGPARGARCVAAFVSLPTEPPTEALIAGLRADGVDVLVPITRADLDLDWQRPDDDRPLGRQALARADVVVVPALAVDAEGRRLGQGGGSYDRALPRRRADAPVVALVFDDEVLAGPLPADPHDMPVTGVVTASGWRALPSGDRPLTH